MVEIRFVGAADRDALFELRARAFGPLRGESRERVLPMVERDIADQRVLGVYDGARLVASGRFLPMDQWWHGGAVPTGGVASVYVAPDERGRGIGARLAAALVELVGARGRPLSALYPATVPVYRRAGYEHGGAEYWTTFRAEALRGLGGGAAGDVKIRQVGPDDAAEVVAVLRAVHAAAGDCGPLDRGEPFVRWTLEHPDLFAYLADDGFVAYHWSDDLSELIVERAVAGSAETARALWALVGSGSSTAEFVRARVAPYDPVLWLLRDHTDARIHRSSWMLRVVDAQAAIAARGFPAAASVQASLVVDDPLCPGNAGGWRLVVAGGRGRLERDAAAAERPEAVRLTARGLAAVYAGVPPSTLSRAELIGGGGTDIAALAAAFAASPYMLDDF